MKEEAEENEEEGEEEEEGDEEGEGDKVEGSLTLGASFR